MKEKNIIYRYSIDDTAKFCRLWLPPSAKLKRNKYGHRSRNDKN